MKTRLVYILAGLLLCFPLWAQKKCKGALNRSEKLYQEGKFQDAVKTLEPCLSTLKTDEEKFEAFRLLGICYQFLNKKDKAIPYVYKMIQLKPDYHKYPNIDPVEFTQLVNKFHVNRKLYGGIKAGFNLTGVRFLENYAAYASKQEYHPTVGYQLGGILEYYYKPVLSFNADISINQFYIDHQVLDAGGNNQYYTESQQYFTFSAGATYYRQVFNEFRLFAGVSPGFSYLLSGIVNFETENIYRSEVSLTTKETTNERNRFQPFGDLKMGVAYPIGKGFIQCDFTYRYYSRNNVDEAARMADMNFIHNNQYVNNDISLQSLMVNLTYKLPLLWSIDYE